ncbi:MAG TPA: hypothetical protein VM261_07020 [Kofleriaceae bacterium]|nr:hypothetical protein [Kofleriaceae bacterium]
MLRRLATLALSLSLATSAFTATAADARSFAQAPADQPAEIDARMIMRKPDSTPRISAAARAKLRKVLAARRAKNVNAFRAYANRGVYPHNFTIAGPLNVWIDEEGHMCAAATMIFKSGAKSLVRQTGRSNNFVKLGDVTSGALMDWMLTSGLTQSEVALIQEPFMGRPEPEPGEPPMGSAQWRTAEDARLKARYAEILATLGSSPDASIDAAIDTLATRPDLVARLLKA